MDYLRNRGEDYGVIYDERGRINRVLYPGENNQPVMEVEYKYNDADQVTAIIARDLTRDKSTLPKGWTTGGDASWFVDANVKHSGLASAASGKITHDQSTWLKTQYTTKSDGKVHFWWKVSSESGWDKLKFFTSTDGEIYNLVAQISGDQDWAKFETELTPDTTYYFKWEYAKDGSVSTGADRGWIDDFMETNFEGPDIYCMQYDYDTNGRKVRQVIKQNENDPDESAYYVTTFNYDSRDMLVEEKYLRYSYDDSEWKVMYWARYKYDTAGNVARRDVEQIIGGEVKKYTHSFTYSRGYQLMSIYIDTPVGSATVPMFHYDANGNMTLIDGYSFPTDPFYDITQMEFQYDLKNRLTKYRFGGSGNWAEIKYDALGRVRERISADETPITNKYYYDGRQLIQQLDDSNNAEFDYLRGPTGLDRQFNESNDKRYFYIKDPLGTVWAMVESGFTPQQSPIIRLYNYNAWGEHLDASDTNFPDYNDDPNLMRNIGCRVEAFGKGMETQWDAIYHLDHRHYLPLLGRFMQREPMDSGYFYKSIYNYSENNPANNSDRSGLFTCTGQGGCGQSPRGVAGSRSPRFPLPPIQPSKPVPSPLPPIDVAPPFCCGVKFCKPIVNEVEAFLLGETDDGKPCCCRCDIIRVRQMFLPDIPSHYDPFELCKKRDIFQCQEKRIVWSCEPGSCEVDGEKIPACEKLDDCFKYVTAMHQILPDPNHKWLKDDKTELWRWHICTCDQGHDGRRKVHPRDYCCLTCNWDCCE